MINPKPYSKTDMDYFNRYSHGYSPYTPKDLETILKPLEKAMLRFQRPKICEIGCASGQFSQAFSQRFNSLKPDLIGIDIAAKVLSQYPFHQICGSAFMLPLKNNSIDMVCLPAALHHLFPFEQSLKEISRILTHQGFFYCMEPNFFHPHRRLFMQFKALYNLYRKTNDVPINPDNLKSMLQDLGYSNITTTYININFNFPSYQQRIQNTIADTVVNKGIQKYILPWFILTAVKQ